MGFINDVAPFDSINPSAENIAQWFYRELAEAVAGENAMVRAITIWKGPVNSYHVDFSRRDNAGTVVASTINGATNLTLHYSRKDGTLSFFPYVLTRGF